MEKDNRIGDEVGAIFEEWRRLFLTGEKTEEAKCYGLERCDEVPHLQKERTSSND